MPYWVDKDPLKKDKRVHFLSIRGMNLRQMKKLFGIVRANVTESNSRADRIFLSTAIKEQFSMPLRHPSMCIYVMISNHSPIHSKSLFVLLSSSHC